MLKSRKPIPQQKMNEDESSQSGYSSQDDDACLLTDRVQEKLLTTIAKLKAKDPNIYKVQKDIFDDDDFEQNEGQSENKTNQKEKKFTYKDMLKEGNAQKSDSEKEEIYDEELPHAVREKIAKQKFKKAVEATVKNGDDLFVVKSVVSKQKENKSGAEQVIQQKFSNFTADFKPKSTKLISKVWKNEENLDETDLFLRQYILDKKWLTSKHMNKEELPTSKVDEQDEERSLQMDQYEAEYNFRFQEPNSDKLVQFPRVIEQSMRIKPQNRKQKRKKLIERKKQQEKQIRKQSQQKKIELKERILNKMNEQQDQMEQENGYEHDWFFCDDCTKGLQEGEEHYICNQCEDYILCNQCYELIIHKHPMVQTLVPLGFGAPKKQTRQFILQQLKGCMTCRRKIPKNKRRFEYMDRSYLTTNLCQSCYDQSSLDNKKKYKPVETQQPANYEELLEKDPKKLKELTDSKQIEEMVDQYLRNEYEDVLNGGFKTKFKYIYVPAESYGLSDEQILFGDDKELNKYVSIRKLAPYRQGRLRLRNNMFRRKIVGIDRTVKSNKKLLQKGFTRLHRLKQRQKRQQRASILKARRERKLKIQNLSNPETERDYLLSSSRLASYGIAKHGQTSSQNDD